MTAPEAEAAPVIAFAEQHAPRQAEWKGGFSGAFCYIDCTCSWRGSAHTALGRSRREWASHRNAMRDLSVPQARVMRAIRDSDRPYSAGSVRQQTANVLLDRGLIVRVPEEGSYRLTPIGRGVLAEYERVYGGTR